MRKDGVRPGVRLTFAAANMGDDAGDRHDELLRRYLEELDDQPLLSVDEELVLGRRARAGDADAGARLVKGNLRLVVALARRYRATGLPLLDLIQEGNVGLLQAVEGYDPDRGFSFRTYATWWIRQAITRGIANAGRGLLVGTLPDDVGERLQGVWDRFVTDHGRQPSTAELAAGAGVTEDEVLAELAAPPLDEPPPEPAP